MAAQSAGIHEVDFCSQMATAIAGMIAEHPEIYPFTEARVEGFGTGASKRKRKDLRFFDHNNKIVLCGEVKMPGTAQGQSSMNQELVRDAAGKSEDANTQFFFTWNVNEFAVWDRSKWDAPWMDRRIYLKPCPRQFANQFDVAREENLAFIKTRFLPDIVRDLAEIISGRRQNWWTPPDDLFIRSLESHLEWPVQLASAFILEQSAKDKKFSNRIERWMQDQDWTIQRSDPVIWQNLVDNMAKTLAYVWANRLIFYKALRARFPELPRLELKTSIRTPDQALNAFNGFFQRAVERSGDYEPLMMPDDREWATELVFQSDKAIDAWRGLLHGLESVDFREVPSDVVGRIFQKLIGPDERHRYGQHFTGDDVVDVINAFCIHDASDSVFDPACGSGSFLVRAYYRKRNLNSNRPHLNLIGELFGCDISPYPAHLATLNLAAREINDEANYPRIARRNFFDTAPDKPFCQIPDGNGGHKQIVLPRLDAIVGNPPYVRQEKVDRKDKARFGQIASGAWRGLRLTGRSDLHCYFWPVATRFLKDDGYFGFLTSSSWMDVEYGFALQGWMLEHFRILAVMESAAEPWFEDARVKTCVTILQRCDDETQRMNNAVKFVRFSRKLADIIGVSPGKDEKDERARQQSVERLRARILNAAANESDEDLRIIIKTQADLWTDGVRAGAILKGKPAVTETAEDADESDEDESRDEPADIFGSETGEYAAGKWGRYVRAPDFYFEVMRRFGKRFVALGEIAEIRFGVKSGCDAFFMPRDVSREMLEAFQTDREFRENTGGAPRREVESGKLRIIKAGDGSVHPIESTHVAPEVHSLMKVDRPVVRTADLDRVVLLAKEPLDKLKTKSPWAWRYIKWGSEQTFPSNKSKPVPVPKRKTCAARDPWYNLTDLVKPGIVFWPMAQQYRHIIAANPDRLICNHNLFDISGGDLLAKQANALIAILNSTVVGLFKNFYGRFAGTEGNLKTEVVDVNLLDVPDPRDISAELCKRLDSSLKKLCKREVGRMVEEQLMDCHSPERARRIGAGPLVLADELQQPDRRELDDAVFELLGVADAAERSKLIDRLYEATAQYFREIRIVEIEKMEQRSKSNARRTRVNELAADVWDAAELEDARPLKDWIADTDHCEFAVEIPDERPANLTDSPMFDPNTVYFGKRRGRHLDCNSRPQAELVAQLANLGFTGEIKLPSRAEDCIRLMDQMNARIDKAMARLEELTESRTGDERVREQIMEALKRWFVLGRERTNGKRDQQESPTRKTNGE